jgi:lysyl-tRNA synthetase class I
MRHATKISALPDGRRALTLTRFRELRERADANLEYDAAKSLIRELKAVGGDLRALRVALTGRDRGPELAAVIASLDRDETMRKVDAAL